VASNICQAVAHGDIHRGAGPAGLGAALPGRAMQFETSRKSCGNRPWLQRLNFKAPGLSFN